MSTTESRINDVIQPFLQIYGKGIVEKIILDESSALHSVQKEALRKIIQWFSNDQTKDLTSVVVMPTGTGKTGVICCLPYMFGWGVAEGKIAHQLSKPILVIAPDVTILNQLESNLCYDPDNEYKPFLLEKQIFNDKEAYTIYKTYVVKSTDAVSRLDRTEDRYEVVLCNAQKWRNSKEDNVPNYESLDENLFSAVVVDEAHHLPAVQWKKIIDKFSPAKVVFFTATPKRHDGREITSDQDLSRTKKYTYVLEREEAIRLRLIRDVTFQSLPTNKIGVLRAVKNRLEEKNRDTPLPGNIKHAAIIITKNINEAKEVESICKDELNWKRVRLVCSEKDMSFKTRKQAIKEIKTSDYELIIIVAMLLEGFDHPPLSVAGIVTNIQSRLKFAQFVGRIQRLVRIGSENESEDITGDIITADEYKQNDLFFNYKEKIITDEPSKSDGVDED